jgi:hypothetical protein
MRFVTTIAASLIAFALAVPSPAVINKKIKLAVAGDRTLKIEPHIFARQEQCNIEYCTKLYESCVHSCESLSNGDW